MSARRSAVFCQVIGGEDLNLVNRIDVLPADDGTRRTGSSRDHTIDRDEILVAATAVDVEPSGAEAVGIERVERSTPDTRLQQWQINGIPSVQWEVLDVFRFDRPSKLCVRLK